MTSSRKPGLPIKVDDLRVGMFVQLDVGWMRHPFPVGSFRIADPAQIETIRGLGLETVRWRPEQSDAPLRPGAPDGVVPCDAVPVPNGDAVLVDVERSHRLGPAGKVVSIADSGEALARQARRRLLAGQRAAAGICEGAAAAAARSLRELTNQVPTRPVEARVQAERLVQSLVDTVGRRDDVRIRLLGTGTADAATTHALNVSVVSLLMGRMLQFPAAELHELGLGALLHDVGLLDVPARLRVLGEHCSSAERRCHEQHVAAGVAHARRMGLSSGCTSILAQHHERGDGRGYPLGLDADRIGLAARIVGLADRYDELCNPAEPSRALTPHEAVSRMFAQAGAGSDTALLGSFIRMMGVYPAGSAVQLTDDRHAMVVSVNAGRPLKPRVLVHDRGVPRGEALVVDLERTSGLAIRRSVRPTQLPSAAIDYFELPPRIAFFVEAAGEPCDREPGTERPAAALAA